MQNVCYFNNCNLFPPNLVITVSFVFLASKVNRIIVTKLVPSLDEVYYQRSSVNRLLVFIGASVLIGALGLRNTYM